MKFFFKGCARLAAKLTVCGLWLVISLAAIHVHVLPDEVEFFHITVPLYHFYITSAMAGILIGYVMRSLFGNNTVEIPQSKIDVWLDMLQDVSCYCRVLAHLFWLWFLCLCRITPNADGVGISHIEMPDVSLSIFFAIGVCLLLAWAIEPSAYIINPYIMETTKETPTTPDP